MDRLTERTTDGFGIRRAVLIAPVKQSCCTGCKGDCDDCSFKKGIDKLAAYEDTGLEPCEILTGLELANVYAAMHKLKRYENIGTVEEYRELMQTEREQTDLYAPVFDESY